MVCRVVPSASGVAGGPPAGGGRGPEPPGNLVTPRTERVCVTVASDISLLPLRTSRSDGGTPTNHGGYDLLDACSRLAGGAVAVAARAAGGGGRIAAVDRGGRGGAYQP